MPGVVIAFSGAIGAGKSTISQRVAELMHWPRVSFGEYVQHVAETNKEDPKDRAVLQRLGQALVLSDVEDFVTKVLAQKDWRQDGNLVVDGLRHAEVRVELLRQVRPNTLKHVYIELDEDARLERVKTEEGVEPRLQRRYDQDITEAQVPRILKQYRDVEVGGDLPVDVAARQIISRLGLSMPPTPIAAE